MVPETSEIFNFFSKFSLTSSPFHDIFAIANFAVAPLLNLFVIYSLDVSSFPHFQIRQLIFVWTN